jgi:hypothetical protein
MSILLPVVYVQSGQLRRKPSGGERAGFLEEESEPRTKRIFLAGENPRADGPSFILGQNRPRMSDGPEPHLSPQKSGA